MPALLALALFAAFRLPGLTRYVPWTDETLTISYITGGFMPMIRALADTQTNPPLAFALLWIWNAIGGEALWWLRLLPCVFGILTALPVLAICRRIQLGRDATVLAVAFTASSQFLVFYSNELRMYSLFALLAAVSMECWLRLRDDGTRSAAQWLTVVNVLLVYTHFFGCLVVAVEWVCSLPSVRPFIRRLTMSAAITAASLVPWTLVVVRRARITRSGMLDNAAGILRPQFVDLFDPYWRSIGLSAWPWADLAILCAIGGVVGLFFYRARDKRQPLVLLALAATIPTATAMTASLFTSHSLWISRYMIGATVPLLILAAGGIVSLLPHRLSKSAVLLAIWPAAITIAGLVDGREKVRYERMAGQIVAATAVASPDVYAMDYYEGGPLLWLEKQGRVPIHVTGIDSLGGIKSNNGWIVWSEHHPPRGAPPSADLIRRGYTVGTPIIETGMFDELLGRRDSVIALPFSRRAR